MFCIQSVSSADSNPSKNPQWKKVKEVDGIALFTLKKPKATRFRGVGRVTVNDPYSIIVILQDYENMPDWFALVSSIKEIHQDDFFNRYMYGVVNYPIIKSREFVAKIEISQHPGTQSVTAVISNQYDYIPLSPDYVRFTLFNGLMHFDIISKHELELTYELEVDVLEHVPSSAINYFLRFAPYLTIKNLREVAKNPKYHNLETDSSEIQFK